MIDWTGWERLVTVLKTKLSLIGLESSKKGKI